MPSVSKSQARLMQAVAYSKTFAKKVGIPQSVGREFHEADKAKRKGRDRIARALISREGK
jgi:phosphoribosylamine-glycine ligase